MEILENHPMDKMTMPRAERYEASFYNQDEINTLFKVFEGDPLELIVHIAAYYGLRRCEILGLRWDAIDFQNKTITIQRKIIQVYDDDGVERLYVENRLKTNSTRRTLPLIPHIEEMLLAKKKTDEYFRRSFGKEYDTEYEGFICHRPDGKIIEPNYLTSHFGYIIKSRGMRHLRFHDLRHLKPTNSHNYKTTLLRHSYPPAINEDLLFRTRQVFSNLVTDRITPKSHRYLLNCAKAHKKVSYLVCEGKGGKGKG